MKTLATRFARVSQDEDRQSRIRRGIARFCGAPNVLRLTVGDALVRSFAANTIAGNHQRARGESRRSESAGVRLRDGAIAGRRRARRFSVPVQMKKNRPGTLLTVLAKPEDAAKLDANDFCGDHHAGRAAARRERQVLARKWVTVPTSWGEVRMKIASMNGTVTNYAPEYEDCRRIAAEESRAVEKRHAGGGAEVTRKALSHKGTLAIHLRKTNWKFCVETWCPSCFVN